MSRNCAYNKLLKCTPATEDVASAGQPTLRFGCPLARRYVLELFTKENKLRFIAIILCVVALQACSVSRIKPEILQPDSNEETTFPVAATIMIYIPQTENEEKIMMHYGYGNKYLHKPGKDLEDAALAVANLYFKNTSLLSLEKNTHYVLKLEGEADLDHIWGVYKGEIKGTLYDSKGSLIYSSVVKDSTTSAVVNDENAFYNSYVNASKELFDKIFFAKGSDIVSYSKNSAAELFNVSNNGANEKLELVSTGSGFFVNNQGQVVTNKHVVSECLSLSISIDGEEKTAKIIHSSENIDLAILDTGISKNTYIAIQPSNEKARLGEEIIAIGFPLHGVLSSDPSLTTGNISSLSGLENNKNSIQISSPIQPGNSGGPLLNKKGYLVGVVQSKLNTLRLAQYTGDIAQNVNFAINTSALVQVLDESGITYKREIKVEREERSTPDIADEAIEYTVQVMCRG